MAFVERSWFFGFLLVIFGFFVHPNIQALCLIPIVVTSIILWIRKFNVYKGKLNQSLLIPFISIFLLMVIGTILSEDTSNGWQFVQRNLAFLIMPFVLVPALELNTKQRQLSGFVFQLGILVSGVLCLANSTLTYFEKGSAFIYPGASHFVYNIFMSHLLVDPFGLHPIYYSFYITIGSVALLQLLLHRTKMEWWKLAGLISLLFFQLVLIYLLKSAVFSMLYFISLGIVLLSNYWNKWEESKTKRGLLITVVFVMMLAAISFSYKKVERVSFDYELSDEHLLPLTMRMAIWECVWPVVQDNWAFGVGTGDQYAKLYQSYVDKGFFIGVNSGLELNAHNQYLQYLLAYGVPGVLLLLSIYVINLWKALRWSNPVYFLFVFCFMFFSLTESTLQTQNGILFFTILISLFNYLPDLWHFRRHLK